MHGVERPVTQSGAITGQTQAQITVTLPELRKVGSSSLVVTLNPSLAGVMLDALPYLADYPYGCVEQTMSRFLPSVLAARSLQNAGYTLADLQKAARQHGSQMQAGGKDRTTANSAYTYPERQSGRAASGDRCAGTLAQPRIRSENAEQDGDGRPRPPERLSALRRRLGLVEGRPQRRRI